VTRAVMQGIGMSVPERIVTNHDLEKVVETSHDWIVQRTGIVERRVSGPDETTGTLALAASKEALTKSGIGAEEIDMVICGTVTGDMPFPSTSCIVQDAIGARNAGAMDVGAACAGFIYSLSVASAMIESGQINTALVIGADALTKYVDWSDRATCVLFGDGAGAAVVRGEESTDRGVLGTVMLSDGSGGKHIRIDIGGSRYPMGGDYPPELHRKIFMAGAEVYRFAVTSMGDACCKLLERLGMEASEIDLFVPHQANLRIIESAAHRLNLPPEKVMINVQKYGNTSGGSIPIGLYEAEKDGRLRKGMTVMTVGFGAGLVWGANLIRW